MQCCRDVITLSVSPTERLVLPFFFYFVSPRKVQLVDDRRVNTNFSRFSELFQALEYRPPSSETRNIWLCYRSIMKAKLCLKQGGSLKTLEVPVSHFPPNWRSQFLEFPFSCIPLFRVNSCILCSIWGQQPSPSRLYSLTGSALLEKGEKGLEIGFN